MAESYYCSDERRAQRVQELFASIAERYDFINDIQSLGLHRRWKKRLMETLNPLDGAKVLDLCCGTGDLALHFSRGRARSVVGLDFCQAMLDQAARRTSEEPESIGQKVQWMRGDALDLPFDDAQFDVVTCAYGLRNLADFEAGLAQMIRVTAKGGRLRILDFGQPLNPVFRKLYFLYLRLALPVFGAVFAGDSKAYAYILESLLQFPDASWIRDKLLSLGGKDVEVKPIWNGAMNLIVATRQ